MVLRRDAVANLENVAEGGVWSRAAVVRKLPGLAGEWSIDDAYSSLCSRRIQVCIDERREMLSVAKEIAGRDNCIARNFALHDHVALMNERILKSVSEVVDAGRSRRR